MTAETISNSVDREPELLGQTVVVIGGSAEIGLETARKAREGADVVLTGRDPERLERAALDVDVRSTAAFANDAAALKRFFDGLPDRIDHVMVTAGGPHYGPLLEMDSAQVHHALGGNVLVALEVARSAATADIDDTRRLIATLDQRHTDLPTQRQPRSKTALRGDPASPDNIASGKGTFP